MNLLLLAPDIQEEILFLPSTQRGREPYEVVVADDASTDRTFAVAEASGARVVRCAHPRCAA